MPTAPSFSSSLSLLFPLSLSSPPLSGWRAHDYCSSTGTVTSHSVWKKQLVGCCCSQNLRAMSSSADETLRAKPVVADSPYKNLPLKVFAEFMAMVVFVFIGCGTAMAQKRSELSNAVLSSMCPLVLHHCITDTVSASSSGDSNTNPAVFQICLAFGMAIVCLVYSCWAISGGHLNPAVTTALMISGHHPVRFHPSH